MKKIFLHSVLVFISFAGYCQTVSIPDPAFLSFIKNNYPQTLNNSDELIISQAALVTSTISCPSLGIKNLEGIQYFTQTPKISAIHNSIVSIPSLVPLTNLQTLHLYDNQLTFLPDFTGVLKLKTILIYQNQLTELPKFDNNPALEEIIANQNKLTSVQNVAKLSSLLKLDVGENKLTALPDLSKNTNLQELICWSNQLRVLPDLSKFSNLVRLNAGKNKLTKIPNLKSNTQMSILALDNNLLTDGPDLSLMTGLTSVKLYNNYLSFEDLLPYTKNAVFSSTFNVSPMNTFKEDSIEVYVHETAYVSTDIDQSLSNVSYKFFEAGAAIAVVSNDTIAISQASSGIRYIYAEITHPAIPGLTLKTDSIVLYFHTCPLSSAVTYSATKIDCSNSGTVKIAVKEYHPPTTTYQLRSLSQGNIETYSSSSIKGLIDTAYTLQINFSNSCILDYPTVIKMPYVDCKEVFMTPNNDGDMDTYFFTGTGSAIIYDKNGKEVKRITLPYEWNGYASNGLVAPGYYVGVINGGKDRVYISVLY